MIIFEIFFHSLYYAYIEQTIAALFDLGIRRYIFTTKTIL